ncbi:MAG: winged helix-turn-helix transcriptional regulator [Pleurocapsa sp. SU_196_0]|nr:winged helix-turn-helix transcriptional regulator [Pleurocapsa sp. SU_196_0]
MKLESPTQFAWRRFSRGLPESVSSVEDALKTGQRSFAQWRACLETANHLAARVHSHVHRRGAGSSPQNVAWRSLRFLSDGESRTATEISRQLRVHPDVVRRALKRFRERGWVTSSQRYSRDEPRTFTVTVLGLAALERVAVRSSEA